MLISTERRFVFIAVPKTATTSIERRLMQVDSQIRRNQVPTPSGDWVKVHKHATSRQVADLLGPMARDYTFVAFVREPTSVVVSKYFYYCTGRGFVRSTKTNAMPALVRRVRVARSMPMTMWALVYPYSAMNKFLLGKKGEMLVARVGLYERLQEDCRAIFSEFGYSPEVLDLSMENRTEYRRETEGRTPLFRWIVKLKSWRDWAIYSRALEDRR